MNYFIPEKARPPVSHKLAKEAWLIAEKMDQWLRQPELTVPVIDSSISALPTSPPAALINKNGY